MLLRQPTPDALLHFSDYLLERFGLVASMQVALVASVAFYAFAIVGLGFKVPNPRGFDAPHNVLDVVLVNAKSATKPTKADALAQANLDGGGNTDDERRAKTPLPPLSKNSADHEIAAATQRVDAIERQTKELLTRVNGAAPAPPPPTPEPTAPSAEIASPTELMHRTLEAMRLEAQIAKEMEVYQQRPKRRFVGARAEKYRFARYVEDWRMKIERVGNLNNPEAARELKLYGSLLIKKWVKGRSDTVLALASHLRPPRFVNNSGAFDFCPPSH